MEEGDGWQQTHNWQLVNWSEGLWSLVAEVARLGATVAFSQDLALLRARANMLELEAQLELEHRKTFQKFQT